MNMNVSLPEELANFVKDKVSTGRYGSSSEVVREALRLMEDRPSQISVLPVAEPHYRRCLGLVRLHDLYQRRTGLD